MSDILTLIRLAKDENKDLFYNSSGSKKAYQLGIKHISSAEYLGFADTLPNGDLYVKKDFLIIDFEENKVLEILKNMKIRPVALEMS